MAQNNAQSRFSIGDYSLENYVTLSQSKGLREKFLLWLRLKKMFYLPVLDFLGESKIIGASLLGRSLLKRELKFLSRSSTVIDSDIMIIKGPISAALNEELEGIFEEMASKKWVMYIGPKKITHWAESSEEFDFSDSNIKIDVYIPGARPSSLAILNGMELLYKRVSKEVCAND